MNPRGTISPGVRLRKETQPNLWGQDPPAPCVKPANKQERKENYNAVWESNPGYLSVKTQVSLASLPFRGHPNEWVMEINIPYSATSTRYTALVETPPQVAFQIPLAKRPPALLFQVVLQDATLLVWKPPFGRFLPAQKQLEHIGTKDFKTPAQNFC